MTRCNKCGRVIGDDEMRYQSRTDPAQARCVQCVMIAANEGRDLTKHPGDHNGHLH